jgi:hypothetical protein
MGFNSSLDVLEEDNREFENFLNKVVDCSAFGGKVITNRDVIRTSRDLDFASTGIQNSFWIRQAFIAGRESMRPKPQKTSDEEQFKRLKELASFLGKKEVN